MEKMSITIEICRSRRSLVYRERNSRTPIHTSSLRTRQKGATGCYADTPFSNDIPDSRGVFNYARWVLV